MSAPDKQIVEDILHSYDSLLDQDPEIQERVTRGQQQIVIAILQARFPALVELAQQQVARLSDSEKLSRLAQQIAIAPDEAIARWALTSLIV